MNFTDVRTILVSEMQSANYGNISVDISMDFPSEPDDLENTIRVTYGRQRRRLGYNDASTAPAVVNRDANGNVTEEKYPAYYEAVFPITVHGLEPDEPDRTTVFGAIEDQFVQYEHGPWDVKTLDTDIIDIETTSVDAVDATDVTPPIRRDSIRVSFEYVHYTDHSDDTMQSFDRTVNL